MHNDDGDGAMHEIAAPDLQLRGVRRERHLAARNIVRLLRPRRRQLRCRVLRQPPHRLHDARQHPAVSERRARRRSDQPQDRVLLCVALRPACIGTSESVVLRPAVGDGWSSEGGMLKQDMCELEAGSWKLCRLNAQSSCIRLQRFLPQPYVPHQVAPPSSSAATAAMATQRTATAHPAKPRAEAATASVMLATAVVALIVYHGRE